MGYATPIEVLLVEDNPDDVEQVRFHLGQYAPAKFSLTVVPQLKLAFTSVETKSYGVIVLDPGLPDSQGGASVSRLSLRAYGTPLVVLTGNASAGLLSHAEEKGAVCCLEKSQATYRTLARRLHETVLEKQRQSGSDGAPAAHVAAVQFQ